MVRFARLIIAALAFLADLGSAPPAAAIQCLTWLLLSVIRRGPRLTDTACLPVIGAGSGLQLFIPGTGPSLQVFIVAGQAATEITR